MSFMIGSSVAASAATLETTAADPSPICAMMSLREVSMDGLCVQMIGALRSPKGWMSVDTANVYYDHPAHAPLDHALGIDFVNEAAGGRERVAVELSAESARELIKQIEAALANGEREHAIAIAANKAATEACEYLT